MTDILLTDNRAYSHPVWGVGKAFKTDPLGTLRLLAAQQGNCVEIKFSPFSKIQLVRNPALAKKILSDRKAFPKVNVRMEYVQSAVVKKLRKYMDGTPPPKQAGLHRKLVNPLFSKKNLIDWQPDVERIIEVFVADLRQRQFSGKVAVLPHMKRLNLRIAAQCILGVPLPIALEAEILAAMDGLNQAIQGMFAARLRLPPFVPTQTNRALHHSIGRLAEVVYELYRLAQQQRSADNGFSSLFAFSHQQMKEMGATGWDLLSGATGLLISAHETSSTTMAWILYQLAQRPKVVDAIRAEIKDASSADEYTRQVVLECLRFHTPTWAIFRKATAEFKWAEQTYTAGSRFLISPLVFHGAADLWQQPNVFDPGRFRDPKAVPPGAFIPFGQGGCLGERLSMMQMTLSVKALVRHFDFKLVEGADYSECLGITIAPREAMPLEIIPFV